MIIVENKTTLNKNSLLRLLKEHKSVLNEKFGISEFALFGSYARDEASALSDVDLVVLEGTVGYFDLCRAENYLEESLHKKIDLGFFKSIRPIIKKRIQKEMIRV